MILQVTNTEVRRSDEAQLAGYWIIYEDKKEAAQLIYLQAVNLA